MAQTNVWAPVGSPGSANVYDYNAYQGQIPQDAYEPPSPSPSNQSRNRFTSWFSRSRSGSPAEPKSRSRSRSRSKSPNAPPSPSSFVVRNVVKQTGGVSWDNAQEGQQYASPNLEYKRSKSKPLGGGGASLGVPPGGPGGGTGYGTAFSSNDGRPEPMPTHSHMSHSRPMSGSEQRRAEDQQQQFQPPARPVSPGHTKAAAFQRPRSQKSPSPAPSANSQRERAQQHRFSISPGPMSWKQQNQDADILNNPPHPPFSQDQTAGRPVHTFPASIAGQPQYGGNPQHAQPQHFSRSPQQTSPLSAAMDQPSLPANRIPGFDPSQFRPSDSNNSLGPTPMMPNPKRQSVDAKAAGFGFMGGHEDSKRLSSSGPPPGDAGEGGHSPGFASRIRGFFNTPTRNGNRQGDDDSDDDEMAVGTPYGVSSNAYQKAHGNASTRPLDAADREAEIQRQKSHREAVRLIDQEREAAFARTSGPGNNVPSLPSAIARELAAEGWTPEALQRMTEDGRQNLVRRLTANGKVSREASMNMQAGIQRQEQQPEAELDWENLTPAQKIIAETRSRQMQRERAEEATQAQPVVQSPPVQSKTDTGEESMEVPVRRGTRSPKKGQSAAKFPQRAATDMPVAATPPRPQPTRQASAQPQTPQQPIASASPANAAKVGLSPGTGPMPNELGLMGGLQEMMTRFYRYERYSVPLLRAIEMRLVDIERDAQMAHNKTGDGASDHSGRTEREKEMDKWVGQMTSLMRHEIGQLRAATKEIREGRELLGEIARTQGGPGTSRFSSAQDVAAAASTHATTQQLTLPPGAAPALDKDQGKAAHGQQVAADIDASRRARSTSPNGRPKYTNALGMPLADGRKSPERATTPVSAQPSTIRGETSDTKPTESSFSIEAQDETIESGGGNDDDDDDHEEMVTTVAEARSRAIMTPSTQPPARIDAASPPLSDVGSTSSSSTSRRRDVSVNERLKKLMADAPPSRSGTQPASIASVKAANDSSDAASALTRSSSPQALVQSVEDEVENRGLDNSSSAMRVLADKTSGDALPRHLRDGSSKSQASSVTVKPGRNGTLSLAPPSPVDTRFASNRRSASPLSSPASPQTSFVGGRTSPSPASYAGNSTTSPVTTMSGFLGRQGSTSPGVPNVRGENIKTSNNASSGLRARAQSYLMTADGSSAPTSPSLSKGSGAANTTQTRATSSPQRSSAAALSRTGTASRDHAVTPPLTINKQKSSYFNDGNNNSSRGTGSSISARERARSSPAPNPSLPSSGSGSGSGSGSKLMPNGGGGKTSTAGMTLKERVAFFEVSANK